MSSKYCIWTFESNEVTVIKTSGNFSKCLLCAIYMYVRALGHAYADCNEILYSYFNSDIFVDTMFGMLALENKDVYNFILHILNRYHIRLYILFENANFLDSTYTKPIGSDNAPNTMFVKLSNSHYELVIPKNMINPYMFQKFQTFLDDWNKLIESEYESRGLVIDVPGIYTQEQIEQMSLMSDFDLNNFLLTAPTLSTASPANVNISNDFDLAIQLSFE